MEIDLKMRFHLMDDSKPLSEDNKIIASSIALCSICACGMEASLTTDKFTDNLPNNGGCGWNYRCRCGKIHSIPEYAFDGRIEYYYENNLMYDENEEE